ncbi:hypothetical protein F4780DRAFT_783677 [Xylariomycetidae sp. FL0641]|nr:hypothetical protein F4780DRAFT_783677 [Xylariomycetidae sp. FL0641]
MASPGQSGTVRHQVARILAEQLANANIDWNSVERLSEPVLCIEAKFQERSTCHNRASAPGLTVSEVVDLTGVVASNLATPERQDHHHHHRQSKSESLGKIVPTPQGESEIFAQDSSETVSLNRPTGHPDYESDLSSDGAEDPRDNSRKDISGLRPSRVGGPAVEDDTQRQMQITDASFPKRRKAEPTGYVLKPSTLDKLIVGIWEQIHGGLSIDPQELLGQFIPVPLLQGVPQGAPRDRGNAAGLSLTSAAAGQVFQAGRPFNDTNLFCRKVTQASRTCRSIEVIVQARWVEHFEAYVEHLKVLDAGVSETKRRKAALMEACSDFGWTEKELRNKMAVWRGYQEIKDAGGWAALVFAGMGIYRFCKYRIGFDRASMQRLRRLRPALEVAADTLHPNWRQLLAVVGSPATDRVYAGHPHDWVVGLDGAAPAPLRSTYLPGDPHFSFRHVEESVVDGQRWGGDDPRWTPPKDALAQYSSLAICETCGQEQSDDPKLNCCYCFPSLFGCSKVSPSPVQVFRTPDGRNNGLMALCAFERGAAVGEFVGVITKGFQDVDVMESTAGAAKYQIWQGRQGNFTRFINHSCKANAQYQSFTWMNTQRIVLVSKGIEAGSEITVDYSDKYWKGLDKKCLCGEKSCRYKKIR